jgi:hypothetical protein
MLRLATAVFLVYTGLLAFGSRAGFPTSPHIESSWPVLSDKPIGEDGFYMLTIAWHLAESGKLAYNDGELTTGTQPLATFVYAGLALAVQMAGGDRWTLARLVVLFGGATLAIFAWQMRRLTLALTGEPPNGAASWMAYVLTLFSFQMLRTFTYGLETGVYLILITFTVTAWLRYVRGRRERLPWQVAILCGASMLARLDFAVVLAVCLAIAVIRGQMALRHAVFCGAISAGCVAPWLLRVWLLTGSWIPSSGLAESGLPADWEQL